MLNLGPHYSCPSNHFRESKFHRHNDHKLQTFSESKFHRHNEHKLQAFSETKFHRHKL